MKKLGIVLRVLCLCAFILLSGGEKTFALADSKDLTTDISTISMPEGVTLVGLGEASHGNSEFQQLKLEVFKALVVNNGCKVFAIEGDFGGAAKVNDYIHNGKGSAREAVAEIGFAIYRTQEMADLVQWMHDYNETCKIGQDLHFYGFDMQRYDNSKEILFNYLDQVDSALSLKYQKKLAKLTDDTMFSLNSKQLKIATKDIKSLMKQMKASSKNYKKENKEDYDLALECAQCILENTKLRSENTGYNETRDMYMKNKVDWIVQHEKGQMVFLNGHNGHIEKSSAVNYTCMGSRLSKEYGDAYFSIGTDVSKTEFNAVSEDENKVFTVKNANDFTGQLSGVEGNLYYLDFSNVEKDSNWQNILNAPQAMIALNAEFSDWQSMIKQCFTLTITPAKAYDGVIIVKNATPSHKF